MGVRVTSVAGKLGGGGGTKDASRRLGSILGHRDPHTGGSPPDRVPLSPSSTHHETLTPPPPQGLRTPKPSPPLPQPPPPTQKKPRHPCPPSQLPWDTPKGAGEHPPPPPSPRDTQKPCGLSTGPSTSVPVSHCSTRETSCVRHQPAPASSPRLFWGGGGGRSRPESTGMDPQGGL